MKSLFKFFLIACVLSINVTLHANTIRFESKYGAYPAVVKSDRIEQTVLDILSSYNFGSVQMTETENDFMIRALRLMYDETNNKAFLDYISNFEKATVNIANKSLTEQQLKQYEIFSKISDMSLNKKVVLDKELRKTLIENFRGTYDDYHKTDYLKQLLDESKKKKISDRVLASLFIYNTAWGINQSAGMMWLDTFRVPVFRSFIGLIGDRKNVKSNTNNKLLIDAAFIATASQLYKLTLDMSQPMAFVLTNQYHEDIRIQKEILSKAVEPNKSISFQLMRKAAEAQLKNKFTGSAGDARDADRSWYRGAFFTGMMAAWRASSDDWYLNESIILSNKNKFAPGPNAMHDANDLNISQVYIELHEAGKVSDIKPTKIYLDSLMQLYNPKKVEWSWCDALYMAPATWAGMSKVTGDIRYLNHMNKLWWQTTNLLYDKKHQLFYRDLNYTKQPDGFQIKERNGENIFWGRGNGWVMGALPRIIDYMPQNYSNRKKYEKLFQQMCNSLLALQGEDGLWRASLLDTESYPMGETSSTTFFCYAFAWGINNNLLDAEKFTPSVKKAWTALCALVNKETGRLEYVQLPADSPRSPVYKRCNVEYATGAFLLAGSEVVRLLD